jgi:hypothetical protein
MDEDLSLIEQQESPPSADRCSAPFLELVQGLSEVSLRHRDVRQEAP